MGWVESRVTTRMVHAVLALAALVATAFAALAIPVAGASALSTTTSTPAASGVHWQTAWTSPMDYFYSNEAHQPIPATNATYRDIAQLAVGGQSIKIQLSNTWSTTSTTFAAVTVGVQQSGAAVVAGTLVPVTFQGSSSITIAAGQRVMSDPVAITVHAGESLSISLWVAGSATVSLHNCCVGHIDSYGTVDGAGNQVHNPSATKFIYADYNMRWLSAIAVAGSPAQATVVAFGDSITEGFNNAGLGWPTPLQQRIAQLPPSQQVSVVDEGIAGNTVSVFPPYTSYAEVDGGLPGVTRVGPDALDLPGVRYIIMLLGTNDIWFGAGGENMKHPIAPYGSAASIEAAMSSIIAQAHARGVKIIGATLLPRSSFNGGNGESREIWTPSDQAILAAVNAWILSPQSGFDATINLAAVMGDVYNGACQPATPFAPYYTVDNLHPNTAGQTAMANAIATTLFGIPQAPQVASSVVATPTPNCPGATLAAQVLALGRAIPTTTTTPSTTTSTTTTTTTVPAAHRGVVARVVSWLKVLGAVLAVLAVLVVILRIRRRRRAIRRRQQARAAIRDYRGPGGSPPPGGFPRRSR